MPYLPPEIVNSIIDLLHDNPGALKRCCLVSSSWVARARKCLFHHVHFKYPEQFSAWKKNFPDPIKSPAVYTRFLRFANVEEVTDADASWIRSFTNVERLELEINESDYISHPIAISLVPFHNLSPAVKSLELRWRGLPLPKIFDLIFSLPPLEYLYVGGLGTIFNGDWDICRSPRPPVLTGTLVLGCWPGFVDRLLKLPLSVLRFQAIVAAPGFRSANDFKGVRDIVERCFDTLESVNLNLEFLDQIDLSKATKLKEVELHFYGMEDDDTTHVIATLNTITPEHDGFKQVKIRVPCFSPLYTARAVRQTIGGEIRSHWTNLDRALIRLWESHRICVKILWYPEPTPVREIYENVKCLFPEMTERGKVDLLIPREV